MQLENCNMQNMLCSHKGSSERADPTKSKKSSNKSTKKGDSKQKQTNSFRGSVSGLPLFQGALPRRSTRRRAAVEC